MPTISGPAYIAMKTKNGDLWLDPHLSQSITSADFPSLPIGAAAANDKGPDDAKYYAPVRTIRAKVGREYAGINSSGGPQVSGRSDQADFFVEQNANAISPYLYEQCCNGIQMEWVHLACLKDDDTLFMHIVMQDVNITGYEFEGNRKTKDTFVAGGNLAFQAATTFDKKNGVGMYGVRHLDRFTLLYTSIAFRHAPQNITGGWNTGSDSVYPSPPPSA